MDLVFQVPRDALGLGPAPARGKQEEAAKIANGVFVEVKRMAVFDLSDRAIESYPGPLEATIHLKRGIPEAKAAPKPAVRSQAAGRRRMSGVYQAGIREQAAG